MKLKNEIKTQTRFNQTQKL